MKLRAVGNTPVQEVATATTGATFQIKYANFYVRFLTLTINDNVNFFENKTQEFKTTITWNYYKSETTTQRKNKNLDFLIDPTLKNINKIFVILFKKCYGDPTRYSFDEYHIPLVGIKDFNALIENKLFFWSVSKKQTEFVHNIIEISENDYYTTGNLLDFSNLQNYYKPNGIDLARQTNTSIPR